METTLAANVLNQERDNIPIRHNAIKEPRVGEEAPAPLAPGMAQVKLTATMMEGIQGLWKVMGMMMRRHDLELVPPPSPLIVIPGERQFGYFKMLWVMRDMDTTIFQDLGLKLIEVDNWLPLLQRNFEISRLTEDYKRDLAVRVG